MGRRWLWPLFMLLFSTCCLAYEGSVPVRWHYLEDRGYSLDQVRDMNQEWVASKWQTPNLGYTQSGYWFRMNLSDSMIEPGPWILSIRYGLLNKVHFYMFRNGQLVEQQLAGTDYPRNKKARNYRFPTIAFDVMEDRHTEIYIWLKADVPMQLAAELFTPEEFMQAKQNQDTLLGLFLGILVAMILYNLVLYLSVRDRAFLFYVAHSSSLLIFMLVWQGIGITYLWPDQIGLQKGAIAFSTFLIVAFSLWFCGIFLRLEKTSGLFQQVFWGVRNSAFLGCLLTYFIPAYWAILACSLLSVVAMLLVVLAMFQCVSLYYRPTRLFLMGWTVYLLGASVLALNKFAIIENTPITENLLLWGSIIDMVLLCIALGDKFHEEGNLKLKVQELSIKAVQREKQAKQEAIENQRKAQVALEQAAQIKESYTRELKLKVEQRTRELTSVMQRLEKISEHDSLTGLKNRRFFMDHLCPGMVQSVEQSIPFSVLMVDIDHFKMINDRYGHLTGDECLMRVAQVLNQQLTRPGDVICRYGGEEFIVYLASTEAERALQLAEQMRLAVARSPMLCGDQRIMVTISVGVLNVNGQDVPGQPDQMIQYADQALYQAKATGRNCVYVA